MQSNVPFYVPTLCEVANPDYKILPFFSWTKIGQNKIILIIAKNLYYTEWIIIISSNFTLPARISYDVGTTVGKSIAKCCVIAQVSIESVSIGIAGVEVA